MLSALILHVVLFYICAVCPGINIYFSHQIYSSFPPVNYELLFLPCIFLTLVWISSTATQWGSPSHVLDSNPCLELTRCLSIFTLCIFSGTPYSSHSSETSLKSYVLSLNWFKVWLCLLMAFCPVLCCNWQGDPSIAETRVRSDGIHFPLPLIVHSGLTYRINTNLTDILFLIFNIYKLSVECCSSYTTENPRMFAEFCFVLLQRLFGWKCVDNLHHLFFQRWIYRRKILTVKLEWDALITRRFLLAHNHNGILVVVGVNHISIHIGPPLCRVGANIQQDLCPLMIIRA